MLSIIKLIINTLSLVYYMEALQTFILLKNTNDPKSEQALNELKYQLLSFQTLPPSNQPPNKEEYQIYRIFLNSHHIGAIVVLLSQPLQARAFRTNHPRTAPILLPYH